MNKDETPTDATAGASTDTPHPLTPALPETPAVVRKGPGLRRILQWLALAAAGGVVGYGIGKLAKAGMGVGTAPAVGSAPLLVLGVFAVGLLCSLWPHILLHEAGHALAGRLVGMRPVAVAIGRQRWERKSQRWRRRDARATQGVGGYVMSLPTSSEGHGAFADAVFLSGGAAANLLVGALAIGLASMDPSASDAARHAQPELWRVFVIGFGVGGLLLGAFNLLPLRVQGWNTDGRLLLDTLLRRPEALTRRGLLQVMALSVAGVRPRNWPATMLPDAQAPQLSPMARASALGLRVLHALDSGNTDEARTIAAALHALEPTLPVQFRPQVALSLAMHAALCERDAALLAAWRARTDGLLVFDGTLAQAWLDTEQAHLAGDALAAAAACARVHAALDDELDLGMAALVQARLTTLDPTCLGRSHSRA